MAVRPLFSASSPPLLAPPVGGPGPGHASHQPAAAAVAAVDATQNMCTYTALFSHAEMLFLWHSARPHPHRMRARANTNANPLMLLAAVWTLPFTQAGSICFASHRASCLDWALLILTLVLWCDKYDSVHFVPRVTQNPNHNTLLHISIQLHRPL